MWYDGHDNRYGDAMMLIGLLILAFAGVESPHLRADSAVVVSMANSVEIAVTAAPILTADDGVTILTADGTTIPLGAK